MRRQLLLVAGVLDTRRSLSLTSIDLAVSCVQSLMVLGSESLAL